MSFIISIFVSVKQKFIFDMSRNKKSMKLSYALVDLSIEEGWTLQLAYFCHIKTLFGNGIIYDFSYESLANKLGISKSACYKNVRFLLDNGLVTISKKGHLIPLSNKGIVSWYKERTSNPCGLGLLTIKIQESIKKTEWNIFARVPINCIKQQKYRSSKRAEVNAIRAKVKNNGYISSKEYKMLKAFENNTGKEVNFTDDLYFVSDELLARRTGKSISTVRSMIKFWVEEGLIQSFLFKGSVIDKYFNRRAYEAIKIEQPNKYSDTYYYKGNIVKFNKRALLNGHSLNI